MRRLRKTLTYLLTYIGLAMIFTAGDALSSVVEAESAKMNCRYEPLSLLILLLPEYCDDLF